MYLLTEGFSCSIMVWVVEEEVGCMFHYPEHKWVEVFKNGPSKTCGRQPSKADHITSNFLKAVFH